MILQTVTCKLCVEFLKNEPHFPVNSELHNCCFGDIDMKGQYVFLLNMGLDVRNLYQAFANNTGADQHPHSLISAFVIRCFKSIICKLATGEM